MSVAYQVDDHRFNNSPLSKRLRSVQLYKEKSPMPSPPSTMKFTITNSTNENEAEREAHYNQMRKLENELKLLLVNVSESNSTISKLKADSTQYLKGDGDTSKVILKNYKLIENKLPGMRPFQSVVTKLDNLIMTVSSIQRFRETLDSKISDMQAVIKAETEDIKIIKQEVSDDLDQIHSIDDRVTELEGSVEQLINARDDVDEKSASKEFVLNEKKETLTNINGTIKMVNNQLRNVGVGLDDHIKSNDVRVSKLEVSLSNFVEKTDGYHRSQSKSVGEMNTNIQMVLDKLGNQVTEMRSRVETLEKQNSLLRSTNRNLEETVSATQKKVEELEQYIYYMNESGK